MHSDHPRASWGTSQQLTHRVLATLEHFLRIEAVSGILLIAAAVGALLWANSPLGASYETLWHTPVIVGIGGLRASPSLHFLINEAMMTVFFLVAGLEIRRELHEGALSSLRLASLPLTAALGGVLVPAVVYLMLNPGADASRGWAIPIATDIAFAVGVLALLGSRIPRGVRVLLLALAIIDDVLAVIVIALFYSQQLNLGGGLVAAFGIGLVLFMQRLGIRPATAYIVPGAILWFGLWRLGVHPTLAGVILGLLTPVAALEGREGAEAAKSRLRQAAEQVRPGQLDGHVLNVSLKEVQTMQLALVPPVVSVETALHPWVAYCIMPLFALANAGVSFGGAGDAFFSNPVGHGVMLGLLVGKPLGILLASLLAVRLRLSALPDEVGRRGLLLVALLGGIGFTMSIFIATLAFDSGAVLEAAKLSVLIASGLAAVIALAFGALAYRLPIGAGTPTRTSRTVGVLESRSRD